jgi:hypothetical protein
MTDKIDPGRQTALPQDADAPGAGLPDAVARRLNHLFRRSLQAEHPHPLLALMRAYRARQLPTEAPHD